MGSLCVITARGGSKRIPRKNVREFCGRPIIAYSIDAALASGLFDEVMVSTDDGEIAEIARSLGAAVPFMRSPEASDDYATTRDVALEVLSDYAARGREFDALCVVYPTAPFVTADKIKRAKELLDEGHDTVLAVTAFSFPPQRGLVTDGSGGLAWWQPEHRNARSQDLPAVYHDAGQLYWTRPATLRVGDSMVSGDVAGLVVPETEVQDIDNPSDWEIAEMKYERMVGR